MIMSSTALYSEHEYDKLNASFNESELSLNMEVNGSIEEHSVSSLDENVEKSHSTSNVSRKSKNKEVYMPSQLNDSVGVAEDEEIFECVKSNASISVMMHTWLAEWKKDKHKFAVRIINFVLQSSGLNAALTFENYKNCPVQDSTREQDQDDAAHEYIVELISGLVDTTQDEEQIENCPLLCKSKEFKGFESSFSEFWSKLPEDMLSQDFFSSFVSWFYAMSTSRLRPLRYTASCAIFLYAINVATLLKQKVAQNKSLQHSKKTSSSVLSRKVAEIQSLEYIMSDIFEMFISSRYRDFLPLIRIKAIETLCSLMELCPNLFLNNRHLKYLGWLLFDRKPRVRLAAVNCFLRLARNSKFVSSMSRFLEYYKQRLGDIVTEEFYFLSVSGFRVLSLMKSLNKRLVTEQMESQAFARICSAMTSVREAAAVYILETINDLHVKDPREMLSERKLRLLLNIIEDKTPGSQNPIFIVDALTNVKADYCPLYDWNAISSLLSCTSKKKMLHPSQQVLLAKILMLTAKKIMGSSLISKNQKSTVKFKPEIKKKFLSFLVKKLPALLKTYKAEHAVFCSLAYLPRYLQTIKSSAEIEEIKMALQVLSEIGLNSVNKNAFSTAFSTLSCLKNHKSIGSYAQLELSSIVNALGTQSDEINDLLVVDGQMSAKNSKIAHDRSTQFELTLARLNELNKVHPVVMGPSFTQKMLKLIQVHLSSNRAIPSVPACCELIELVKFTLVNSLLEIYAKATSNKKPNNKDNAQVEEECCMMELNEDCEADQTTQPAEGSKNAAGQELLKLVEVEEDLSVFIQESNNIICVLGKVIEDNWDSAAAQIAFVSACQLIQLLSPSISFFGVENLSLEVPDTLVHILSEYYSKVNKKRFEDEESLLEMTCCFCKLIESRLLGQDSLKHSALVLVRYMDAGEHLEALIEQFYARIRHSYSEIEIEALKLLETSEDIDDLYEAQCNLATKFLLATCHSKKIADKNYSVQYCFRLVSYAIKNSNEQFTKNVLFQVLKKLDVATCKLLLYIIDSSNNAVQPDDSVEQDDPLKIIRSYLNDRVTPKTPKKPKTPSHNLAGDTDNENSVRESLRTPSKTTTPSRARDRSNATSARARHQSPTRASLNRRTPVKNYSANANSNDRSSTGTKSLSAARHKTIESVTPALEQTADESDNEIDYSERDSELVSDEQSLETNSKWDEPKASRPKRSRVPPTEDFLQHASPAKKSKH